MALAIVNTILGASTGGISVLMIVKVIPGVVKMVTEISPPPSSFWAVTASGVS